MLPGNPHLIEVLRDRVGPDLMPAIFESGYNLDFFDDDSFKQVGRVDNGSLLLGRNKYKIIILPGVESIPLETYKKFEEFVRGGGVLIATKRAPQSVPGFLATQKDGEQIVEISSRLFGDPKNTARLVTDEKSQLGRTLNQLSPPDVGFSIPLPEVGFIHRRTNDAEVYFIANTSNAVQRAEITIHASGMKAEEWNPFTGAASEVKDKSREREHSTLDLNLAPYESRMFVFTKRISTYKEPQSVKVPSPIDLSTDWQVSIGTNAASNWARLRSWSDDESTRYFSGTASYTKDIQVPAEMKQQGLSLELQLGDGIPITPQSLRTGSQAWLEGPVR